MTATAGKPQPDITTRLLAGVSVPDTPLISRAIEFARDRSEPYLFNHAMRSWLFAALFAQRKKAVHDAEVLAVTTILHDIGLAESFDGPLRFEVEGANAARSFARTEGVDDRRAQLIWDGVALNSTPSISLYKEAEVALATLGIGLDWGGFGYEVLTDDEMAAIIEAFPRLGMRNDSPKPSAGLSRTARRRRTITSLEILASALCLVTSRRRRWIIC